jgi:hypothetical protein
MRTRKNTPAHRARDACHTPTRHRKTNPNPATGCNQVQPDATPCNHHTPAQNEPTRQIGSPPPPPLCASVSLCTLCYPPTRATPRHKKPHFPAPAQNEPTPVVLGFPPPNR